MKKRCQIINGRTYIGNYRCSITLNEEAKKRLDEICLQTEMRYSEAIKALILKKKMQKKDKMSSFFFLELAKVRTELNKIGANINQIAKNSNADFKTNHQDGSDYYLRKTSNYFTVIELLLKKVLRLQTEALKNK